MVCLSGQCSGPRGHPVDVNESRQIWSSGLFSSAARFRGVIGDWLTFVKLQTKFVLDEKFFRKVVLVKLRVDNVFECRGTCQGTRHFVVNVKSKDGMLT